MATAQLPPCGRMARAEANRQRRIQEMTTPDSFTRYCLREQRLSDSLVSVNAALVSNARDNKITRNILKGVY